MPEPVVQICQGFLRRAFCSTAVAALSLALVVLVQPDGFGASKGKYGTPLKFDKPPVDTGIQMTTPPPPGQNGSCPVFGQGVRQVFGENFGEGVWQCVRQDFGRFVSIIRRFCLCCRGGSEPPFRDGGVS
ncbi:hypothetical protein LJC46_03065 [Desulfovibrio sp. OttesenSCG-928-G15]|nr:hypothetical protein [Desulfovibrio sp. OttesenSCG-928-G15]